MKYGYGIDLGGTTVKLAFFREDGQLLHKWEIPTRTGDSGKHILPDIAGAVNAHLAQSGIPREDILGAGICVPGPVMADGTVNKCVNLGWGMFNVDRALSELTGLPVRSGNDANVAALGECWLGGGKGCDDIVMVTLGTGVGGGIILGGKLLAGHHGCGGEIGHMVLHYDETETCGCGKQGCVEQYCSATGVVRMAKRRLVQTDAPSALRREGLTCKDVFDAAGAGDALAVEVTEEFYRNMAIFLANICATVDPEAIVIGGGVSKAGSVLLEGIARHFPRYAFHGTRSVRFSLATLGNDAGACGAFKLILDNET